MKSLLPIIAHLDCVFHIVFYFSGFLHIHKCKHGGGIWWGMESFDQNVLQDCFQLLIEAVDREEANQEHLRPITSEKPV